MKCKHGTILSDAKCLNCEIEIDKRTSTAIAKYKCVADGLEHVHFFIDITI